MPINLNPVPARIDPKVLAALAKPQSGNPFSLSEKIEDRFREMFFPDAASINFFNCSREGLYEVALNSFASGPVLIGMNGPFSQQWQTIAKSLNIDSEIIDTAFGSGFDEDLFEKALDEESYAAVFLVEIDPFTGTQIDIAALSGMIRKKLPDTLVIVDCSASFGSVRALNLKSEADALLIGSEISLGLPPGLGTVILGERANFKSIGFSGTGWSLNYARQFRDIHSKSFRSLIPFQLLNALDRQLDLIFLEGIENRIKRIVSLSEKMKGWADANRFEIFTRPQFRSPTVTVLKKPLPFTVQNLTDFLSSYGIIIGNCPDDMRDDYFVIAHMNQTTEEEIALFLDVLDRFLADYDTKKSIPVVSKLSPQ